MFKPCVWAALIIASFIMPTFADSPYKMYVRINAQCTKSIIEKNGVSTPFRCDDIAQVVWNNGRSSFIFVIIDSKGIVNSIKFAGVDGRQDTIREFNLRLQDVLVIHDVNKNFDDPKEQNTPASGACDLIAGDDQATTISSLKCHAKDINGVIYVFETGAGPVDVLQN
jgi:hypothetical protein